MYLKPNDPVSAMMLKAFPDYKGKKFEARSAEAVTLLNAYWDGGSRTTYRGLKLDTGEVFPADPQIENPFRVPEAPTVALEPNKSIVAHVIFSGKDLGLRMFLHPSNMVDLLPAVEVSERVRKVLRATRSYKASYGGDPLYRARNSGLDYSEWLAGVAEAKSLGYLDARGAITVEGKNVT